MRVVLDTNVLVSSALVPVGIPARILDLWRENAFTLFLSRAILDEVREVLKYPRLRRRHGLSDEGIEAFLATFDETAVVTPGQIEVSAVEEDPDDDALVACALEGQADFLVTGDRHLLNLGSYGGTEIVEPAAFLRRMLDQGSIET